MPVSVIYIKALSTLCRTYLSLIVAFSACAGYVYFNHRITWTALFVFIGVALLSASASALNQYQERIADGLMKRTHDRPLPSGKLNNRHALVFAAVVGLLGLSALFWGTTLFATLLGIVTLLWYNGIYTPLKRKTTFASIIGALTGAFALLIGWAATGVPFDNAALCIALFMVLWQVAHFLLLLLKFGKEYETAGFPSPAALIDHTAFKRIVFMWVLATIATTFLFPLFNVITNTFLVSTLFVGTTIFLAYFSFIFVKKQEASNIRPIFQCMYLFQASVLTMLIIEGFWRGA